MRQSDVLGRVPLGYLDESADLPYERTTGVTRGARDVAKVVVDEAKPTPRAELTLKRADANLRGGDVNRAHGTWVTGSTDFTQTSPPSLAATCPFVGTGSTPASPRDAPK